MVKALLLDAGPLGLVTNPNVSPQGLACAHWLQNAVMENVRGIVPEIADYEVRRELLRARKMAGIRILDAMGSRLDYLPINTVAMRRAAELWALARQRGQPTADDRNIDADLILAAQALTLGVNDALIVTTNVGHLSRFAPADRWENIRIK